jgi:hypothetical protein
MGLIIPEKGVDGWPTPDSRCPRQCLSLGSAPRPQGLEKPLPSAQRLGPVRGGPGTGKVLRAPELYYVALLHIHGLSRGGVSFVPTAGSGEGKSQSPASLGHPTCTSLQTRHQTAPTEIDTTKPIEPKSPSQNQPWCHLWCQPWHPVVNVHWHTNWKYISQP